MPFYDHTPAHSYGFMGYAHETTGPRPPADEEREPGTRAAPQAQRIHRSTLQASKAARIVNALI